MIKSLILPILASGFFVTSGSSFATDELRYLSGGAPTGWKIIKKAAGDLNGDGVSDSAVIYEEDNPSKRRANDSGMGAASLNTNTRRIVVYLTKNGRHKKISESASFIPSEGDESAPCLADPLSNLSIKNGLLKITLEYWQSCGGWSTSSTTYTFRFDKKGMRLIGEDENYFMRNSGEGATTSTNYLTGTRKTSTPNDIREANSESTWEALPKTTPMYLGEL